MPISNIASDATQFSELCCSEFNVRPTIRSTSRLGTAIEGKIQPLLVTLSTTTEAEDLVSKAKQLRFSRSRQVRDRIYLNKHLTRAEALAAFNLRSLRRSKQSNTASKDQNGSDETPSMDLEHQHLDANLDPGVIRSDPVIPPAHGLNPSAQSFQIISSQSSVPIQVIASSSSSPPPNVVSSN